MSTTLATLAVLLLVAISTVSLFETNIMSKNSAFLLVGPIRGVHAFLATSTARPRNIPSDRGMCSRRLLRSFQSSTLTSTSSIHQRRATTSGVGQQSSAAPFSSAREESFFADRDEFPDFASLGIQSPILLRRLKDQLKLERPTAVQAAAFQEIASGATDVTIGAETGTGE